MTAALLSERHGAALVLTLSDPATRNTLSHEVIAAAIEALNRAEADPDIRAVLLCGAGGHFCAGGNLQGLLERRRSGPPAQVRMLEHLHQLVDALGACPKPVIAAVEGAAAGAGFSLALACDLIVAADDARFILSYGRIGLSPDGGATWQLLQALPRAQVQQMIWLGEPVTAQQLVASGLVSAVVEKGHAVAEALRLAERLGAMAPNALASGKALLRQAAGRSRREPVPRQRRGRAERLPRKARA